MATASQFKGKSRDAYLELVRTFPLSSIRSEKKLRQAQRMMDELLAKGLLSAGEIVYLDALSDLVAVYEDQHHSIGPASDADLLRHLMEAKGISQIDLHRQTEIPKSTISEILSGKKPFSRAVIRTLAAYFNVRPGVLANNP
jgi:HTH-type transcriptional regulator / antitoxin HigA